MMIKKLIIMLAVVCPWLAQAQIAVGEWTLHSPFQGINSIAETELFVYYTSGTSLYSVDKDTYEVQSLNVANRLNDSNITGIYPARDGKSVLVAYESGNMDRLYDNGKLANLSDIKDAIMTGSRKINSVAFGNDNIYVATDFGLVTYNGAKNEVRETAMTSSPLTQVFTAGDGVGVVMDKKFYVASQSDKITSADRLRKVTNYDNNTAWTDIKGDADPYGLMTVKYGADHQTYTYRINGGEGTMEVKQLLVGDNNNYGQLRYNKDGKVYAINTTGTITVDQAGQAVIDASVKKNSGYTSMSFFDRSSQVWGGNTDALSMLDFTAQDAPAVVQQIGSSNGLGVKKIFNIEVASDGSFYFQNMGERMTFQISEDSPKKFLVNRFDGNEYKDMAPTDLHLKYNKKWTEMRNAYRLSPVPNDPLAYVVGSFYEGVLYVKDNKVVVQYFSDNSEIQQMDATNKYSFVSDVKFDADGNLWALMEVNDGDARPRIAMLPAAKVGKETQKSDWQSIVLPGVTNFERDGIICVGTQSKTMLFLGGKWRNYLTVVHTKGTTSVADDNVIVVNNYIDQDNKDVTFYHGTAIVEDKKGRIWIGTDNGVFEITDPSKVTSTTAVVNHLKVPRNDGTNLADYLLASQTVSDIAVDSSNRKWITTIGSGIYLVSENGDQILDHFTTDNSIIPSNTVLSVACDPNSNKVYFGTTEGLLEYNSTSSPGADDFSGVYAYPNPVRPDFTGWITIAGLMENSLVKIADANGNVVHQGRSDGGMFTWDGCNTNGDRVKTGVYFVFASQNATGSSSGAVTKIMVIN